MCLVTIKRVSEKHTDRLVADIFYVQRTRILHQKNKLFRSLIVSYPPPLNHYIRCWDRLVGIEIDTKHRRLTIILARSRFPLLYFDFDLIYLSYFVHN